MTRLSIVMPVLDEGAGLAQTLLALQPLRRRGHELIVVDGGSQDGSVALAQAGADHILHSARGRALQMNAGAAQAQGDVLLFLHADTRLPAGADGLIDAALRGGALWGRFDVEIVGASRLLPLVAWCMNARSRLTAICTGDQALFVQRSLFAQLGGYAELPLMEDIELSRRLRTRAPPACLRQRVQTSGRRWDRRGAWRTVWLMWQLRWCYWRGAAPEALARRYR